MRSELVIIGMQICIIRRVASVHWCVSFRARRVHQGMRSVVCMIFRLRAKLLWCLLFVLGQYVTDVTNALPTLHTQTHVYLDPSPAILNTHSSILPHPFHLFSRFSCLLPLPLRLLPAPSTLVPPRSSFRVPSCLAPLPALVLPLTLPLGLLSPTFYLPPRFCFRRFLPTCLLSRPSAISPPSLLDASLLPSTSPLVSASAAFFLLASYLVPPPSLLPPTSSLLIPIAALLTPPILPDPSSLPIPTSYYLLRSLSL